MSESQPSQAPAPTSTQTPASEQDRLRSIDPLGAAAGVPSHVIFPGPLPQPKKSRTGLIVLSVVAFLLTGMLFSMRWLPRTAQAERLTSTNPGAIGKFLRLRARTPTPDPVVVEPAEDPEAQIIVEPDVIDDADSDAAAAPETDDLPDPFMAFLESLPDAPTPAQLREKEFREATRQLRLQAIVRGTIPAATINQRTVSLGGLLEVPATSLHGPVKFRLTGVSKDGKATLLAEDPLLGVKVEKVLELEKEPSAISHQPSGTQKP